MPIVPQPELHEWLAKLTTDLGDDRIYLGRELLIQAYRDGADMVLAYPKILERVYASSDSTSQATPKEKAESLAESALAA